MALDVNALLDLFTLRPCTDFVTLGVGGMSLSKSPVHVGNLMDTSLFSLSKLTQLPTVTFNISSSELNSNASISKPLHCALNKESNAVLGLDDGCKLHLMNACTALD